MTIKIFKDNDENLFLEDDSKTNYEIYKAIVLDKELNSFKIVSGNAKDKKGFYERLSNKGYIVRKVFEQKVFDWIENNAKDTLSAYLMFSTAFSKWKNNNMLEDYYIKILNDIPQLNREKIKGNPNTRGAFKQESVFFEDDEDESIYRKPIVIDDINDTEHELSVFPIVNVNPSSGKGEGYIPEEFLDRPLFKLKTTLPSNVDAKRILDSPDFYQMLKDQIDLYEHYWSEDGPGKIKKYFFPAVEVIIDNDLNNRHRFSKNNILGIYNTKNNNPRYDWRPEKSREAIFTDLVTKNSRIRNKALAKLISSDDELKEKHNILKTEYLSIKGDLKNSNENSTVIVPKLIKAKHALRDFYISIETPEIREFRETVLADSIARLNAIIFAPKKQLTPEEKATIKDIKAAKHKFSITTDRFGSSGEMMGKTLAEYDNLIADILEDKISKNWFDNYEKLVKKELNSNKLGPFAKHNTTDKLLDRNKNNNDLPPMLHGKTLSELITMRDQILSKENKTIEDSSRLSRIIDTIDELQSVEKENEIVKSKQKEKKKPIVTYKNRVNNYLSKEDLEKLNKITTLKKSGKTLSLKVNNHKKTNSDIMNRIKNDFNDKGDIIEETYVNANASIMYNTQPIGGQPMDFYPTNRAIIPVGGLFEKELEEDYTHSELNNVLFEADELKEDVRIALLKIADDFESSLSIPFEVKDIYLTGSNANYNYTDDSDIDLHLVYDFENAGVGAEWLLNYIDSQKRIFNNKYDITIKGITVEVGVEMLDSPLFTTGIYSVKNNTWVKKPNNKNIYVDDLNVAFYDKIKDYLQIIVDDEKTSLEEVKDTIDYLYTLRKNSLAKEGEFGKLNVIFKELRSEGLLEKLKMLYYKLKSETLSI